MKNTIFERYKEDLQKQIEELEYQLEIANLLSDAYSELRDLPIPMKLRIRLDKHFEYDDSE
jgi:hypothetical protein